MRLVTYVCEFPPVDDVEPSFAQGERLRAWATEHGHRIVAECRDGIDRTDLAGFSAALAVIDSGMADAMAVATVRVLGADMLDQEISRWEVTHRGAQLLSTRSVDDEILGATTDPDRVLARDLLDRLSGR